MLFYPLNSSIRIRFFNAKWKIGPFSTKIRWNVWPKIAKFTFYDPLGWFYVMKWAVIWRKNCHHVLEYFSTLSNTVWKLREFSLTKKNFRQINSLVTYLVKTLFLRNFCQKCVRENSRNLYTTVWKNKKFSHQKNTYFVKSTL